MAGFRVVLLDHGYATIEPERGIIAAAGGELVDVTRQRAEEAWSACEHAQALLVRRLEIGRKWLRRLRRCRIILRYGVGTDNIDIEAATAAGILVGHVPDYCVDEVSTHAIALLLGCLRHVADTHAAMQRGAWDVQRSEPIHRLAGSTLGLVGLGRIGQAVARKLSGWGLRLMATDPYVDEERAMALGVRLVGLDTLCRVADFISLHVPLLSETHHLLGPHEFALMKPSAILINTARGAVVDTRALLAALDDGRLRRAGLDVFEEEPLPVDSPVRRHARVTLSDHRAWYSEESQLQLQRTAAAEVVRVCQGGLPLALANPEVLHRLGRFHEWTANDTTKWQLRRQAVLGLSSEG